jgi:hypothetical protein
MLSASGTHAKAGVQLLHGMQPSPVAASMYHNTCLQHALQHLQNLLRYCVLSVVSISTATAQHTSTQVSSTELKM